MTPKSSGVSCLNISSHGVAWPAAVHQAGQPVSPAFTCLSPSNAGDTDMRIHTQPLHGCWGFEPGSSHTQVRCPRALGHLTCPQGLLCQCRIRQASNLRDTGEEGPVHGHRSQSSNQEKLTGHIATPIMGTNTAETAIWNWLVPQE